MLIGRAIPRTCTSLGGSFLQSPDLYQSGLFGPDQDRSWNESFQRAGLDWLDTGLLQATGWQVLVYTLVVDPHHHRRRHHLPAPRPGAPRAGPRAHPVALLPVLAVDDHRHGDQANGWPSTASTTPSARPSKTRTARKRAASEVVAEGAELYRRSQEPGDPGAKYGHGTPDDWLERNLYSRRSVWGVA